MNLRGLADDVIFKQIDRGSRWSVFILIIASHSLMHIFTQMHIAIIPILRTEFGLNTLTIGLMVSIPLFLQGILTIPAGFLADKVDRSKMIAAGLGVTAVGGILMAQVDTVSWLLISTSLFAVASTLLHPPALSTVGDLVSPPRALGRALGIFGAAGTFGIALGPITLSFLMGDVGWRFVYLMWSLPNLLLCILFFRVKIVKSDTSVEKHPKNEASKAFRVLRNSSLLLLLAILGARAMCGNAINTYITPYFVDRWEVEPATASLIFGIRPLMGILAAPLGGVMVDRIGEKKWIALGLTVQIVSLSIVTFSTSLPWMLVNYLFYAFFGIMEMPAVQSLIAKLVPTGGRGLAFSLSFLPGTLMGAISPVLTAFIVDALGLWYIFPFALVMLSSGILLLSVLWRRLRGR